MDQYCSIGNRFSRGAVARRWRSGMLLACIVAFATVAIYFCPPAAADPPGGASGWTQTFNDTFPGNGLNTNTWLPWGTYTEGGQLLPSPNWDPSPYAADAYYVPDNQYVVPNLLTVKAQAVNNLPPGGSSGTLPYSSSFVCTNNFQQTYGYFECNMDAQITEGDDTAFWMLNRNAWPPEIDVAEMPGAPSIYAWGGGPFTAQGYGVNQALIGSSGSDGDWYTLPGGQNTGWAYHTYGVDWEPTYISWYVDGNLIFTTTDTTNIPTVPMYMIVAMQVQSDNAGGDWFGQASNGTWPQYTYVSWVKSWLKNNSSLAAPTGVSATAGNPWVSLSWSARSGATCYNIYRGTTSGGEDASAIATDVTTTSFTDTNVAGGTQYYYKVAAVNASGSSTMSSEVSATPASSTAWVTGETLGTSRNNYTGWVGCQFTTGSSSVTLTSLGRWVVSGNTDTHMLKLVLASDGSDVAGGEVMVNTAGETAGQFAYMPLPAPLTLPANTTYYLVSTEESGSDTWYDTDTSLTTTSAATLNGSIYYNGSGWSSGAGAGFSYVPVSFTYAGSSAPPAPTGLTARAVSTKIVLSWAASSGATSYNVYRGTSSGGESGTPIATGITSTTYTNTGLTNGTAYYYKVKAVNGSGSSGYSNEAHATPQTIDYVQGKANGGAASATSQTLTFPYPQIAGDLNVVVIGYDPSAGVSSVTDSAGNTYSQAIYAYGTGTTGEVIYYAPSIKASSSNTVTVTYSGTMDDPDFQVMEFSGVSALDQTEGGESWSSSPGTPSATTTAANEVIVGGCVPATTISSLGSGYTAGPNDAFGYATEYKIVSATGSYSAGVSLSGNAYWTMEMATFK